MLLENRIDPSPTNGNSNIIFAAAIVLRASACITLVPIHITGSIRFPVAAIPGVVAVSSGLGDLRQTPGFGEKGRPQAALGIGTAIGGGLRAVALAFAIWSHVANPCVCLSKHVETELGVLAKPYRLDYACQREW